MTPLCHRGALPLRGAPVRDAGGGVSSARGCGSRGQRGGGARAGRAAGWCRSWVQRPQVPGNRDRPLTREGSALPFLLIGQLACRSGRGALSGQSGARRFSAAWILPVEKAREPVFNVPPVVLGLVAC